MKKSFLLIAISLFSFSFKASAESYIGVQTGITFANEVQKFKADIDPRYQNPNSMLPPFIQKFNGSELSDVDLDESFSIGAKAGHYFDKVPFFGVEGEINYSSPDFKRQTFTINNNQSPIPIFPLKETQASADIKDFSGTISLMARYPAFKRVMPYIGVGPTLHYFRIRGNGLAGVSGMPDVFRPDGPSVKQDELAIGVQGKAGVRFAATKHLALDVEYKFNYSPVMLDEFRDLSNVKGSYKSHQIGLALVYRFGKIKW